MAGNVYVALRQQLAGPPCRTFIADMKLRVESADAYFHPDVMVSGSARDAGDPLVEREPLLLVEVLSPSTAACDRGDKFAVYRSLPTLQEYLLIDPDSRRVDLYRRGADGLWVLHPAEPGDDVRLAAVNLTLTAGAPRAEVPVAPPASASPAAPAAAPGATPAA